jgi:hypothetical protein
MDPLARPPRATGLRAASTATGSVNNPELESVRSRKTSTGGALLWRDEAQLLQPRLDRAQRASMLVRDGGRPVAALERGDESALLIGGPYPFSAYRLRL